MFLKKTLINNSETSLGSIRFWGKFNCYFVLFLSLVSFLLPLYNKFIVALNNFSFLKEILLLLFFVINAALFLTSYILLQMLRYNTDEELALNKWALITYSCFNFNALFLPYLLSKLPTVNGGTKNRARNILVINGGWISLGILISSSIAMTIYYFLLSFALKLFDVTNKFFWIPALILSVILLIGVSSLFVFKNKKFEKYINYYWFQRLIFFYKLYFSILTTIMLVVSLVLQIFRILEIIVRMMSSRNVLEAFFNLLMGGFEIFIISMYLVPSICSIIKILWSNKNGNSVFSDEIFIIKNN